MPLRNVGIRSRVLLLTLVPVVALSLMLGPYAVVAGATISSVIMLTTGAAALSLIIASWMGRGIVRPILQLRDAVDGILRGEPGTRIEPTTGGELEALERGFNEMSEAMERSQSRLQNEINVATRRLYHTIEALEHQNRELELARQRALAASREKANFLANMSHEIRTPINAILGYTTLLGKSGLTSEQHEHARTISCASRQLLRVIDDILSLSKLESGTVQLEQTAFDLRGILEDVLSMMAPEARDKQLELVLAIDSDVPVKVRGDPVRIGQVLTNLLSNAIKFTECGGVTVQVLLNRLVENRAEMEIRVTDTGIGIEPQVLDRIFGSFQQADASISRRYGGTGLGLAIVSRLVKLWGGEIGVTSEPQKGSTFWFRFSGEVAELPGERETEPLFAGRKVLLYDDNPAALRAVRNLMLSWHSRVYVARRREVIETMLDAAHESGDTFAAVILGVDLTNEDGGKSDPSGLVDMIRRRHGLPLLLMINCKQTSLLSRSLSDEGIKVVVKPVRRDIIHRNLCCLFGLQQAATAEAASASAAPTAGEFSGLRVLVAEDNDFNRTLVTKILESAGVTVAAAATGHQALELAREQGFDVVIMDLHLPGMDGCETARRLRRLRPDMAQTAIIALTADVFFDDQEKLRAAEMDACLLKPLDEARLWNTIRRLHPGVAVEPAAGVNHGPSSAEIRRLLRPKLVTSIRDHRQQIAAAVDRFDLSVLRSLVHELKGVVGYFGLSDLCREVTGFEQAIDCGADPMELTRRFQRIDELVEEMAAAEPETAS